MDSKEIGMRFSPHNAVGNKFCCALGCKSCAREDPTLRFHTLPKAGEIDVPFINKLNIKERVDRRVAWIRLLKIDQNLKYPTVCSLHFTKDDYFLNYGQTKRPYLKKIAVPSVNLPSDTAISLKKKEKGLIRNRRTENRAIRKNLNLEEKKSNKKKDNVDKTPSSTENHTDTVDDAYEFVKVEKGVTDEFVQMENSATNEVKQVENSTDSTITREDKSVQVEFERYKDFIRNDEDLRSMTGICNFGLLCLIESIVKIVISKYSEFCEKSHLSVKDEIVLTFIKLKQNPEFTLLSVFFKVYSEETCRKVFLKMLDVLDTGFKSAINWPSKQEILNNVQKCVEDLINGRDIIDEKTNQRLKAFKILSTQVPAYLSNRLDQVFLIIRSVVSLDGQFVVPR